ncbi:Golgi apyrase [Coemansia sp. RSA 2131]|nr:Golgi apyrase [Coemansia sp. RSA 2131]
MSRVVRWIRGDSAHSELPGGMAGHRPLRLVTKRRLRMFGVLTMLVLCALGLWYHQLRIDTTVPVPGGKAENDATGDRRKYGVVIDAGSSGSRLMIYAWDDPGSTTASNNDKWQLPVVERASEHWTHKTSTGISSFADRPHRVGVEHIKPLLDFAQQHIPQQQLAHTPVVLLATAGMRLLPRAHQLQILDTACTYARANYDFMLKDCQDSFQVVSGEVEGLFGWIAVNYLLDDGFNSNSTHGFLDMGGASAQIAFAPAPNAVAQMRDELATVTLRGVDGTDRSFTVFVATFLGHGTNEARRRYVETLLSSVSNDDAPVIDDPCLAPQLLLPTTDGRAMLRGLGQFSQCVAATEPLLNKTECPVKPCLFAGVHAPQIDFGVQRFVGVSEYWYASHDYLGLGGVWDIAQFEHRAQEFCSVPWSEARKQVADRDDVVAVARLQMQCFKAAWLVNVLHSGFRVPRDSSPFQSVHNVGETEVSWTLGALLVRVSQQISPSAQSKSVPGIVLPKSDDDDDGEEDNVNLVDDSLWSPVNFVGLRKLIVLWSLQPTSTRVLIVGVVSLVILAFAAALLWLYRHKLPHGHKPIPVYSPTVMSPQFTAESQLNSETEHYALTVLSPRVLGSQPTTPQLRPGRVSPDIPSSTDLRSRSLALAAEESPMSRSSSFSNLSSLNRRRGAGI